MEGEVRGSAVRLGGGRILPPYIERGATEVAVSKRVVEGVLIHAVANPAPAETIFALAELDRMLPLCDTVLIACALTPETKGRIDARHLALMKPGALRKLVGCTVENYRQERAQEIRNTGRSARRGHRLQ